MDIYSYQAFLTVTETMSIHKAAEKLFISQQALSAHIHRMEKELGAPLFDRHPTLRLTRAGETLKEFAEQILSSENALRSHFADISRRTNSVLCIGINHQRVPSILPGAFETFHQKYTNISIRTLENFFFRLLEDMKKGSVDLAVGLDLPDTRGIYSIPLIREPVYYAVQEELLQRFYPGDYQEKIRRYQEEGCPLEELAQIPVNLPIIGTTRRISLDNYCREHKLSPIIWIESTENEFLFDQAILGKSASVVTASGMYHRLCHGPLPEKLHVFPLKGIQPHTMILCYRNDIHQPGYVLDMVQAIRQEFRNYAHFMQQNGLLLEIPPENAEYNPITGT